MSCMATGSRGLRCQGSAGAVRFDPSALACDYHLDRFLQPLGFPVDLQTAGHAVASYAINGIHADEG